MPNFRNNFGPPPAALIFTQNLANHQLRLAKQNGAILETHGLPMIFLKFRGNRGQSITVRGALFRTLVAATDSPFSESPALPPGGLIFYPEFGPPFTAIS